MSDAQLERKKQKAQRYAQEVERFKLVTLELEMRSEHGLRTITFRDGVWHCTCRFYQAHGTCSHIMAAKAVVAFAKASEHKSSAQIVFVETRRSASPGWHQRTLTHGGSNRFLPKQSAH